VPAEWYQRTESLVRTIGRRWVTLTVYASVGAAAGLGTALLLPSYYTSSAAFQAESSPQAMLSGALGGLASQLGGLTLGGQNNAQFFGDLLTSDAVLRRVIEGRYPWRGGIAKLATVYGYDDETTGKQDFDTVKRLRKLTAVDVNLRTSTVRFSVEARSPELALAIADSMLDALNAANIQLRQMRASAERTFTAQVAENAHEELEKAEGDLSAFYERNRSIASSPPLQLEEARLKRAADMAQQLYVQLRLQQEQAEVQSLRNTPTISIVDPPLLPARRSWPKRTVSLGLGLFLGIIVAVARFSLLP